MKQTAKHCDNLCHQIEIASSLFFLYDISTDPDLAGLILKILVFLTLEFYED